MSLFGHFGRAHDALTRIGFLGAQLCLVAIVMAYAFETVSRYFFGAPTSWSNEVVAYALCIGTFLALPEVTRQGGHVAITILTDYQPPLWRNRTGRVLALIAAVTCFVVTWICLDNSQSQLARQEMLVRVNPIPKVWISIWLVYGFASSGIYFLRHATAGDADVNGAPQY
jgi:TRAP-type C4-dicarboxylate transport system permease small subunit